MEQVIAGTQENEDGQVTSFLGNKLNLMEDKGLEFFPPGSLFLRHSFPIYSL